MIVDALAALIPWLGGLAVTALCWPAGGSPRSHLIVKLSLSVGLGVGLFSCAFFLWLLAFGASGRGLREASVVLLAGLGAMVLARRRGSAGRESSPPPERRPARSRLDLCLLTVFLVMFGVATVNLVVRGLSRPHGDWDAWAIWNARARFIFRAGAFWRDAFSYVMDRSRPDYPVLLPSSIAGLWAVVGRDTVYVPALLAVLFALATVGLTVSTLTLLRGRGQGCLAGIVLLGTPLLITHTTSQYADVPLGFFFLATFALLALHDDRGEGARGFMALAGVTAGLAAWTKNEGLLFLAAVVVARAAVVVRREGLGSYVRQTLAFGAGLGPIAVTILYFKARLAPPNYLLALQGPRDILEKLLNADRHALVWTIVAEQIWNFGGWAVSLPVLLAFYLLLVGVADIPRETSAIAVSGITLGLMVVGYSFIYVISPIDIKYQMDNSLGRLLLSLWAPFVFTYFLLVRPVGHLAGLAQPLDASSLRRVGANRV